jgi:hypothetical protein
MEKAPQRRKRASRAAEQQAAESKTNRVVIIKDGRFVRDSSGQPTPKAGGAP